MSYVSRLVDIPRDYSCFLFGPRQVGKSTLLKHRFAEDKVLVYDLLNFNLLRRLENDPELFFNEIKSRDPEIDYVIVDEVQKLPWILDEVHRVLESLKNPPFFILTGSSARKLKKQNANMLAGRAVERSLFPLLYEEIKDSDFFVSLERLMCFGSLPLVLVTNDDERKKDILMSYVNTYIKEEIKQEALVRNLSAFNHFLLLAANANAEILNYANISRDTGVSLNTVKEYYQILEDTLIGFTLQPLQKSVRQQIAKSPKFYFFDTGVSRALANRLSMLPDKATEDFGKLYEQWLVKEIVQTAKSLRKDFSFSYYRTKDDLEVDLIIEEAGKPLMAIEIKARESLKPNQMRGLKSFARYFPDAQLYCVCLAENPLEADGIRVIGWKRFLELLKG